MSVNRVRVEADGATHTEVLAHLNSAFSLLLDSRVIPHETEFVEEVIESHIRNDGAIEYQGRRVIRFYDDPGDPSVLPDTTPPPFLSSSWIVSGNATTATTAPNTSVYSVASNAASSLSINPSASWSVFDAAGASVPSEWTVGKAKDTFIQPFYFHGGAGSNG